MKTILTSTDVKNTNPDQYMSNVQQDGLALHQVPEDVQLAHPHICVAAVQQDVDALRYVPESLKTNVDALAKLYTTSQEQLIIDLKLLRVKNEIICRVLSHLSYNIARESLQNNNINNDVLRVLQKHITTESKDETVVYHPAPYLYDINQPGWAPTASNMTEEVQRELPEISNAAVQQNGRALEFVPKELRDEKMCMVSVQQNGWTLEFVPEDLRDEKMCLAAVQQDGWALEYVPENVQLANPAICMAAIAQDGWVLEHVPEELIDEKMCLAAVQQDGLALHQVPEAVKLANPDIPLAAVQQNSRALRYVPEAVKLAHPEICMAAVQQDGWALIYVPEELIDEKMCLAAVQQNSGALRYVPEELKTNVEALAKLYTTSEEQLRSDLRLLQINDDVIEEVICSLKAPIATSSSMIVELLGTGNDSKQPAENPVESIDIIPEHGLLTIIQEYVHSPSNQENDAKESKGLSPL